ncbi:hypothetical protein QE152_g35613 [Popillia japonica]|uniref:Uncharacterized protein n=1 Tax=Popillia japonica TaxID=7064 RepID=A0AAW1IFG3_POPJA
MKEREYKERKGTAQRHEQRTESITEEEVRVVTLNVGQMRFAAPLIYGQAVRLDSNSVTHAFAWCDGIRTTFGSV